MEPHGALFSAHRSDKRPSIRSQNDSFFLGGGKVIWSGSPLGKRWRQMWNPLPVSAEKYIQFPSGDHAALVHLLGTGPTGLPDELPSKGTRRQGNHPRGSISTTRTHLWSGER